MKCRENVNTAMKRIFVVLFLAVTSISVLPIAAQKSDEGCAPEAVKKWMIQRQVGRNKIQPILDGTTKLTAIQAMLLIEMVRRDLEDLERPACADDLYHLTIFFYDSLIDHLTFQISGNQGSAEAIINPRLKHYNDTVDTMYEKLQAISGVDIMAEANKIEPVATVGPTPEPPKPISFDGKQGGVVLGPVDFPSGVYRASLTGVSVNIQVEGVSGTCIGGTFIYVSSQGGTVEEVFRSNNCRALIQVGQTDHEWKLEFKLVQ